MYSRVQMLETQVGERMSPRVPQVDLSAGCWPDHYGLFSSSLGTGSPGVLAAPSFQVCGQQESLQGPCACYSHDVQSCVGRAHRWVAQLSCGSFLSIALPSFLLLNFVACVWPAGAQVLGDRLQGSVLHRCPFGGHCFSGDTAPGSLCLSFWVRLCIYRKVAQCQDFGILLTTH